MRHTLDAGTWLGGDGLIDVALARRAFPAAWASLFHPSLPLWGVRSVWATAAALSMGLTLGIYPRLSAAGLFVVSVSGLRALHLVSTPEDIFLTGVAFWLVLLPSGTTLSLTRRKAADDALSATVPGAAFRLFLLSIALVYINTGLWSLASEVWRQGLGLFVLLRSPLAYRSQLAASLPLLTLEVGSYLVLAAELAIPLLLALPRQSRARWMAIPALVLLHAVMLVTVRAPFIHVLLMATPLLFFDEELVEFLVRRRGQSTSSTLRVRPLGSAAAVAFAYVVTLVVALASQVPLVNGLGRGAGIFLGDVGLTPHHRLHDLHGVLHAQWRDVVTAERSKGDVELMDPVSLWPAGLRSALLQAYLAEDDGQAVTTNARAAMSKSVRQRLAARFCSTQRVDATITATLKLNSPTPAGPQRTADSAVVLARFRCAADGAAELLPTAPSQRDASPNLASLAADGSLELPWRHSTDEFVGSEACTACHAAEADAWRASPHARSLSAPSADSVSGEFNADAVMISGGQVKPVRQGDRFFMEMNSENARASQHSVDWVIGSGQQLQAYLSRTDDGRFVVLPIMWVAHEGRWRPASLYGSDSLASGQPRFWEMQDAIAARCFECHTSAANYRFDGANIALAWREPAVSCEACHGPGREHVEAERQGKRAPLPHAQGELQSEHELAVCRQCHSAATPFATGEHWPLERYDASLASSATRVDGTAMGLSYESSQLALSGCHQKGGATCSSCHDVHGLSVSAEPCTQCHADLVVEPARRQHSRHASASCVDCHMPKASQLDTPESGRMATNHTIAIPRPRESLELGTPNACDQCHKDKSPTWAIEAMTAWELKKALGVRSWVSLLARARRGERGLGPALAELAASEQPSEITTAAPARCRALERAATAWQRRSESLRAHHGLRARARPALPDRPRAGKVPGRRAGLLHRAAGGSSFAVGAGEAATR